MGRLSIDLNADLGEGEPHDALLLTIVSSCNIACGGHTGDTASMTETVQLASRNAVSVGAHPSYPDREGFGRRGGFSRGNELLASLTEQVESLAGVCHQFGVKLNTLKAHGALYNDARDDDALAAMLVQLAAQFRLALIGLPESATQCAADRSGLVYLREGFADRRYQADGSLAPRGRDGALIVEPSAAAEQALRLARGLPITTLDGGEVRVEIDTLCLHGDTPGAASTALAVQSRLTEAGIDVARPDNV